MPKIAVLGSSGFLGAAITRIFLERDYEVVALSRTQSEETRLQEFKADLFNEDSLKSVLTHTTPDIVISTAWDTEHGKFWTSELNAAYRDATLRFAELSFESGVETFVGLGTMSEYGISPGICNAEISQLVASDVYSKSKIETGMGLKRLGERYGKQTHWVRVFQAFGPYEKPERFVPGLISSLTNKGKFSIRTPNYEMDWIHTTDIASAIAYTLENGLHHFVDIGTGIGTSVKKLSEIICEEFELDQSLLDFSGQIGGHEKKIVVNQNSQLLSHGWKPDESLRKRIRSLRYTS